MKQSIAIAVCLLASLGAVRASAQDHAAKANVPFGFYVGDTWVPAGTYVMSSEASNPLLISIRNAETSKTLMTLGGPDDPQPGSNKLVFAKYGDKYFLHEIQSGRGIHVAFSQSKRERLTEEREASVAPPSTIYLALR